MPIYAPTLPPRPERGLGDPPALVLARFDVRRVLRQRIGMFFLFTLGVWLLIKLVMLYVNHLLGTKTQLAGVKDLATALLPQGAAFQADFLSGPMLFVIWLLAAFVGGGLVARDTLHRIRPLMYAHPVRPSDYWMGKALTAVGLPLAVMLPFILLPWLLSLLIAGAAGPVWPTLPLRMIPAALAIALLMGAVTLGASALAATPRAGVGWSLGILFGLNAPATVLAKVLDQPAWQALSPTDLAAAWPQLLCGVAPPSLGWLPTALGTVAHLLVWAWILRLRTRPSEAVL